MSDNVQFSPNQLRVIDWLATPKLERRPMTQELLAAEMGLNPRTITRWKDLPGFQAAITSRSRELLNTTLPEIYGALWREAEKGSYQHIKLALELTGEYVETRRQEGDVNVTFAWVEDDNDTTKDPP